MSESEQIAIEARDLANMISEAMFGYKTAACYAATNENGEPTHWMPLPQPPTPKEKA